MPTVQITLSSGEGQQTIEINVRPDTNRVLHEIERMFKLQRYSSTQPILEILTLQEDRPASSNLYDVRPNTP